MRRVIKNVVRKALDSAVIFKSHEFRLSALDLVKKTPNLRNDFSGVHLYLDWRHDQIKRFNLGFYQDHPVLDNILEYYHGKVDRVALVVSFLRGCLDVPGDVAEFGVYKGHTAAAIDRLLTQEGSGKKLHLFDSFAGLPDITHPLDSSWKKGDLSSSITKVQELFEESPRAKIIEGYFSDTFPDHPSLQFSFCHVDSDLYTSVKECIDYIMPRLSSGGVIVFDDYGFRETPGGKAAIEERFGSGGQSVIPLPTAQAVYFHRAESPVSPGG